MNSFELLSQKFALYFDTAHFPDKPETLYGPNEYFLHLGGKKIRPVLVLMGNELFDDIHTDSWQLATAVELFHNFTLIHDDMMDKAPLRRGMPTVHHKYGENTALLAGDVMLVTAYDYLNKVRSPHFHRLFQLFNKTAREVCEGQQLDIDFESREIVSLQEYLQMIQMKTSVLLAASLQLGAIMGGAGERNQNLLYESGKKLGIAFQIQDDYLDAYGDSGKVGKRIGGDIVANKKTFLWVHAMEVAAPSAKAELQRLIKENPADKVEKVLQIFRDCKADEWCMSLKNKYMDEAFAHLEDIAVVSYRKEPLTALMQFLVKREY